MLRNYVKIAWRNLWKSKGYSALNIGGLAIGSLYGRKPHERNWRTKGIGASVFSITRLLSKEFVMLVLIACVIAFPVAYWAMDNFLQTFDYRISLGWGIFVISGLGALILALITVSSQAIRAAVANPVESLRDE